MILREQIPGFNELTALIKDYCIEILSNSYTNGDCRLGNNGGGFLSERESFFMVITTEFDDERIILVKRGSDDGYPYSLVVEANRDNKSTYEIGLMLDELEDKFPQKMIESLEDEFYKF
ncbi:hypothetical protein [Flagellimonas sp.]|uniref:hypothetical protein n=1 Tax=Flagellimonas sp. TaxID=2058762 RepID=UPI003B52B140